ncbi:MAG: IS3 family transposase [Desulfobacteraceae bacterium]|nr:IS3 family transposase [Desulfobacteraceae bacterium]
MELITEACNAGARKRKAAELLGLPVRTVQRWEQHGLSDNRKGSRAVPANKMSEAERERIIDVLESPEYGDSNPNQIVPKLADQGIYLGSESTMYRILRDLKMNKHRQSSQPSTRKRPEPYVAIGPNQVWSWDITYLPSSVKGSFFYLYMIMDVYSRKAVAYQVYECESGELAGELITDACYREKIPKDQLVLHSDNGAPMKAVTMLAKLQELGVMPSFSHPSVSDDNPYSESLFRTMKYRPEYPEQPFEELKDCREWADGFVHWYNNEHLHSGIRYVTPTDRHQGKDIEILKKRHQVYLKAKAENPKRWSRKTRNWNHIEEVLLNKGKIKKVPSAEVNEAA